MLLRHDAPLIAAMLAALKAGGTTIVLDPRWPPERLQRIRRDVDARLVLVDSANRQLALAAGFASSGLIELPERPEVRAETRPEIEVASGDLSFLIHTSGSTGSPKCVMQTHRNVVHNAVVRLAGGLGVEPDDRIVLLASPSGGQGISTVWVALLTGATLCPFPAVERGVTGLPEWLEENQATVMVSSASLFRHFVRTIEGRRLEGIRLVRLGSEQVFASDFEAFREHFPEDCRFANSFSTSETGNVTQHVLQMGDEVPPGPLSVGTAVAGMEVSLLDDAEIAVGGDYLSPGYWGDPELTDRRFGERLFRTGDLGTVSDDGLLSLGGRKDFQVKVRGSRVDLVEVESALASRPAVAATAVVPRPATRGESSLTAYVALHAGADQSADELREALRSTLPPHAIPTAFAFVDSIPLTAHGKVDREALTRLEPNGSPQTNGVVAVTETEELLAEIWCVALERDSIVADQDFFDLEGDSLTAAEIAAAVHERFGVELELDAFAAYPTVPAMAELIERRRLGDDSSGPVELPSVSRDQPIPCSLIQERTWHLSQTPDGSARFTVTLAIEIRGPLQVEALRRSIKRLVGRHESLRTTFTERDGEPVQVVHPVGPIEIPLEEVDGPEEAEALLASESRIPFDLERGPLVRFKLIRLEEGLHWLVRVNHHINADGRSWDVFFRELPTLYEADLREEPPPLSELAPTQYADFAAWERETVRPDTPRWRRDVEWWRSNLEGAPTRTPLPFQRLTRTERASVSDGIAFDSLPSQVSDAVTSAQRELGATTFMLRLAAFSALLAAMTGEDDVVVGAYGTTRRLAATRDTFGFFANPVALRLSLTGNPSFREWLAQVRSVVVETSAHAQTPYDALCDELRERGTIPPEFQAVVGIRTEESLPDLSAGVEMTRLSTTLATMAWGFTLQFKRLNGEERMGATFDARLHEPRAVRIFLKRYQHLLGRFCTEPDLTLSELIPSRWRRFGPLLRRRVVERR